MDQRGGEEWLRRQGNVLELEVAPAGLKSLHALSQGTGFGDSLEQ